MLKHALMAVLAFGSLVFASTPQLAADDSAASVATVSTVVTTSSSGLVYEEHEEEAPAEAAAEEEAPAAFTEAQEDRLLDIEFMVHNLWIAIAAFLVFIMHLGFSALETGLTQAKNTTNILFKNVFIICIGLLTYAICGFNYMYPGDWWIEGVLPNMTAFGIPGKEGFDDPSLSTKDYYPSYPVWTDFLFQGMFAATAATIISGCVAERIKLLPFLIFSTIYVAVLYPVVGSWHWGGGWVSEAGFYDFAGSTLVHSVGGWGGLAAIIVLGARKGKYGPDGSVRPILPSNMPMATVGVFLLWFGWFGFNGGSVLAASPADLGYVVTTTSIAAAIGGITAGVCSWIFSSKPDLSMALNGILAGLVGITAAPDTTMLLTVIVGLVCGVAVYFSVLFFDKIKIDDPVGALSVHLVCGIIGTLFAGANADGGIVAQIKGIVGYGVVSFVFGLVLAYIVKAVLGWRVSEEEEDEGLDLGEHGMSAYNGIEAQ